MELGEKIKLIRKNNGFTQAQLSNKTGISLNTIRGYESGKFKPKQQQLAKISKALGVNETIFYNTNVKPKTVGDIINLLFDLEDVLEIELVGEKQTDDSNNYKPDTVALKFKSEDLQNFLADWAKTKDRINAMENELNNVSDNEIKEIIEKIIEEQYQQFKDTYSIYMLNNTIIKTK